MATTNRASLEERALILAPTGRDSMLALQSLSSAGIMAEECRDMHHLCQKIPEGAGMALIADEALDSQSMALLQVSLAQGPPWSDLPLVILTVTEGESRSRSHDDEILAKLGNVTSLERPIRSQTLITAVTAALRARHRQYQVRDLLRQQQTAVERVDLLAEIATHLLLSDRPEEIVSSVFRKIAAHFELEVYLCYLVDEKTQRLRLSSYAGLSPDEAAQVEWLRLDGSICGAVAQHSKRIVVQEVQWSNDAATARMKARGVTAYACFPLLATGRLIGTLSFGLRCRERFEHEELAMLDTVCNQVAVAIDRQRTEEALQELNQVLENRVQERTSQLQEINDQMEAFTYSISHDLRAPLRAIRGFAQALTEDYGATLDTLGRDYLYRMGEGANRLDRLIQDLLQYSRLSRSTITFEPLHLEEAVERLIEHLQADVQATEAQVKISRPLPDVLAHGPTLEQVLTNLICNALKFVAPGVKPKIEIWSTFEDRTARLWIKDNGIGIDPSHLTRIFGVFERLHTSDAYPGTGIGLAIVAKGIARMGGTVGVESAPGQGSSFWIELPRPVGGMSVTGAREALGTGVPI